MAPRIDRVRMFKNLYPVLLATVLSVGAAFGLSGCAAPSNPTVASSDDPYEAQNRKVHAFNRQLDKEIVRPVSKTYVAVALAVRALKEKQVRRIVLTRPAVEAGENLGFLPGDMQEKLDPYMQPIYDALYDMIPSKRLAEYIENRTIEIAPLAYMRGRTLDHAFVILDASLILSLETKITLFS